MKKQLIITAAALCMAPQIASAQEAEQRESWASETIVVTGQRPSLTAPNASTATRTDTPVEEIPQSIQTLTRTLIEEQDLQTPADALVNVSGVVPVRTAEIVLQSPIVRGFEAQYFIDGLPAYGLPDSVVDPGTLINVERIEVAKGPTSTLYGGGTGAPIGGLINFVSRAPGDAFGGEAFIRAGSYNTLGAGGGVDLPFEGGGVRLAGMFETADSYIDVVDSERAAFFPTLALDLGTDTRLTLRGQWSRIEQHEYAGLPAELIGVAGVDPFTFAGAEDAPPTTIENRMLTAELQHDFSDTLQGVFALRRYESEFREYGTFPLPTVPVSGTTYDFASAILPSDVEETFASASLIWRTNTGPISHQILAGIDHDETNYRAELGFLANLVFIGGDPFDPLNYVLTGALGPVDYANPSTNQPWVSPLASDLQVDSLRTTAAYVQDQIAIGDRLDVTLGLRWTRLDVADTYTSFGFPFAQNDETYEKVTPRIGATYELLDGVSAFAGYSEGFQGVLVFTGVNPPEPETSQSYEAGLKFASPIEGLTGTIALYDIRRQNVATSDPLNLGFSVQTGEQRARGLEVDLVYEPAPALSVLASYAYTDAEVTEDNRVDYHGDRLARVPEHSGRLAMRYRFQGEALSGLEIGGGVTYAGERQLTLPNSATVDGFALFDAQASYDFGPASLSFSIVNLTDELEYEPYQYLARAVVIPTQPRSAYVTLRTSF